MSKLYSAYKTDKIAEEKGVWVPESGSKFLLARMGGANTRYQRALALAMKPHMREVQLGLIDEATAEPIMRKVFIDTVLLDWQEVADENDVPMDFSAANADKLFADLPDLYSRLREEAGSYANYRAEALKQSAGN